MAQPMKVIAHPATARIVLKPCEQWNLSQYPDRDPRNDKPASDWYVMAYLDANGDVDFHRFRWQEKDRKSGEMVTFEKEVQPKFTAVTGGGTIKKTIGGLSKLKTHVPKVSQLEPHDIRAAEKNIAGKPTIVRMGLWYMPEFGSDGQIVEWLEMDRKKINRPIHWIDVTEEYYLKWRPLAYKDFPDPYKDQKRPYTRMQELENQSKTVIDAQAEEIARLKADLEKAKKKS